MNQQRSVFLCHSSADKVFVRRLSDHLRAAGVRVWLDEVELAVGDSLIQRIEMALGECDYVCAVISKRSLASEWVQRELRAALTREFTQRRAIVLPILLEQVHLPAFLADKLYADFTSTTDEAAAVARLVAAIYGREAATSPPIHVDLSTNANFQADIKAILRSIALTKMYWAPAIPGQILTNAMTACGLDVANDVLCVLDLENAWFWRRAQTAMVSQLAALILAV